MSLTHAAGVRHLPPGLDHLARLCDDGGLLEHAQLDRPRRDHGYCLDDNARAVVVVERAAARSAVAARIFDRCLAFVLAAQAPDGRFHNRRTVAGVWSDVPHTGDHWGRALWALGHVATATGVAGPVRARARAAFAAGVHHRSHHPRSMAYAALGAAALLEGAPSADEDAAARALLRDAIATIGHARDGAWPWPADRLTYANARLPEALIAAGVALRDAAAVADGVMLLGWLATVEMRDGHMSPTATAGWAPGEPRPAFDQQPIELWALADAAARTLRATCDPRWQELVERCCDWFDGVNDVGVPLRDTRTQGCCDGLTAAGRNANQGAESTLALIATTQRRMVRHGA